MNGHFLAVSFQQIVELIRVIIWPVTLLIIIFKFKTFFGGAINRMQSLDANATGISMTFENKIDQPKVLLKKMGVQPATQSKSVETRTEINPYLEVQHIKTDLETLIKTKAEAYNVDDPDQNAADLTKRLSEIGLFTLQQARGINTLLDISSTADASITPEQAQIVKQLYQRVTH